jgi:hypothetical protein
MLNAMKRLKENELQVISGTYKDIPETFSFILVVRRVSPSPPYKLPC